MNKFPLRHSKDAATVPAASRRAFSATHAAAVLQRCGAVPRVGAMTPGSHRPGVVVNSQVSLSIQRCRGPPPRLGTIRGRVSGARPHVFEPRRGELMKKVPKKRVGPFPFTEKGLGVVTKIRKLGGVVDGPLVGPLHREELRAARQSPLLEGGIALDRRGVSYRIKSADFKEAAPENCFRLNPLGRAVLKLYAEDRLRLGTAPALTLGALLSIHRGGVITTAPGLVRRGWVRFRRGFLVCTETGVQVAAILDQYERGTL